MAVGLDMGGGGADFHVDLGALESLATKLSAVQNDLTTGAAGTAGARAALDPRVGVASSTVRANSDFLAPFAYGLLHEAVPLGHAQEQVAQSLATLVTDLHELIESIKQRMTTGVGNYSEADASVLSAVTRAGAGLDAGAGGAFSGPGGSGSSAPEGAGTGTQT